MIRVRRTDMENVETIPRKQHEEEIKKLKEMYRPNNGFSIPVANTLDFFKWWCTFLRPFVPLTMRETDVVASFLKQRWELSKSISDPAILDTMMMSTDILNRVVEECKITKSHFYVVMSSLKKKNVINGHINPKLVPNLREGDVFKLTILFKKNDS